MRYFHFLQLVVSYYIAFLSTVRYVSNLSATHIDAANVDGRTVLNCETTIGDCRITENDVALRVNRNAAFIDRCAGYINGTAVNYCITNSEFTGRNKGYATVINRCTTNMEVTGLMISIA